MSEIDHMALLAVIADVAPVGKAVDTQTLAKAVFDTARERGEPASMFNGDVYGGFRSQIDRLEANGLLDVDPGVAEFHARDQPAPIGRELYLTVTAAGLDALAPKNPALRTDTSIKR